MKRFDRVIVQRSPKRARKYGMITGETKDRLSWMVLLDGNSHAQAIAKEKVEKLKPEQLAFHFGKERA